jgi:hypothetical protein
VWVLAFRLARGSWARGVSLTGIEVWPSRVKDQIRMSIATYSCGNRVGTRRCSTSPDFRCLPLPSFPRLSLSPSLPLSLSPSLPLSLSPSLPLSLSPSLPLFPSLSFPIFLSRCIEADGQEQHGEGRTHGSNARRQAHGLDCGGACKSAHGSGTERVFGWSLLSTLEQGGGRLAWSRLMAQSGGGCSRGRSAAACFYR